MLVRTGWGLELLRKAILITSYGLNRDGAGTVKVRLPEETDIKQVQPVDLRGRPVGQSIAVKNGGFKVQVRAFAPVSLVFNTAE